MIRFPLKNYSAAEATGANTGMPMSLSAEPAAGAGVEIVAPFQGLLFPVQGANGWQICVRAQGNPLRNLPLPPMPVFNECVFHNLISDAAALAIDREAVLRSLLTGGSRNRPDSSLIDGQTRLHIRFPRPGAEPELQVAEVTRFATGDPHFVSRTPEEFVSRYWQGPTIIPIWVRAGEPIFSFPAGSDAICDVQLQYNERLGVREAWQFETLKVFERLQLFKQLDMPGEASVTGPPLAVGGGRNWKQTHPFIERLRNAESPIAVSAPGPGSGPIVTGGVENVELQLPAEDLHVPSVVLSLAPVPVSSTTTSERSPTVARVSSAEAVSVVTADGDNAPLSDGNLRLEAFRTEVVANDALLLSGDVGGSEAVWSFRATLNAGPAIRDRLRLYRRLRDEQTYWLAHARHRGFKIDDLLLLFSKFEQFRQHEGLPSEVSTILESQADEASNSSFYKTIRNKMNNYNDAADYLLFSGPSNLSNLLYLPDYQAYVNFPHDEEKNDKIRELVDEVADTLQDEPKAQMFLVNLAARWLGIAAPSDNVNSFLTARRIPELFGQGRGLTAAVHSLITKGLLVAAQIDARHNGDPVAAVNRVSPLFHPFGMRLTATNVDGEVVIDHQDTPTGRNFGRALLTAKVLELVLKTAQARADGKDDPKTIYDMLTGLADVASAIAERSASASSLRLSSTANVSTATLVGRVAGNFNAVLGGITGAVQYVELALKVQSYEDRGEDAAAGWSRLAQVGAALSVAGVLTTVSPVAPVAVVVAAIGGILVIVGTVGATLSERTHLKALLDNLKLFRAADDPDAGFRYFVDYSSDWGERLLVQTQALKSEFYPIKIETELRANDARIIDVTPTIVNPESHCVLKAYDRDGQERGRIDVFLAFLHGFFEDSFEFAHESYRIPMIDNELEVGGFRSEVFLESTPGSAPSSGPRVRIRVTQRWGPFRAAARIIVWVSTSHPNDPNSRRAVPLHNPAFYLRGQKDPDE